jgi:biotin carboxyl carrier protein
VGLCIRIDGGVLREVSVTHVENQDAIISIDGKRHRALLRRVGAAAEIFLDDRTEPIWLAVDRDSVFIHAFGRSRRAEILDPVVRSAMETAEADVASAPMPGMVVAVSVQVDEAVTAGQPLVVIESMKMQSEIVAWRDGFVDRVHLVVGDTFDRGDALVGLAPVDEEAA